LSGSRLNNQSGDGSRYQGSSPDRDSSTDFDDIDVDDKSFEEEDDEKIDIENEDDASSISSVASPVSLMSGHVTAPGPAPHISPTWLYGLQNREPPVSSAAASQASFLPQPWALNLSMPKMMPGTIVPPPPVRSFGIDDILHKPLDFSQTSLQHLQHNLRHIHHSFPYKYMNGYMANYHPQTITHTVTSRDEIDSDKIETACQSRSVGEENPKTGSKD